jgi:diguanylate cyclase (GGDEF)-like protein
MENGPERRPRRRASAEESTRLKAMLHARRNDLPGAPTPLSGMRDALIILLFCLLLGAYVAMQIDSGLSPFATAGLIFGSIVFVGAPLLWIRIAKPIVYGVERERARVARRDAENASGARSQEFDARLGRALDMADSEESVFEVVRRAFGQRLPDARSEFLVADSSHAHLTRVSTTGGNAEPPGCSVDSPGNCPAVRRGQTTVFASEDALDACPRLANRPYGACSAACVPVTVMGRAVGVLHVVDDPDQPPSKDQLHSLETLSRLVGARLGLLRAMHRTTLQAATDPLTGLANRRTLEETVRELFDKSEDFALAIADLDHFKLLNDAHGHETGDRALRLFARTMRDAVRPHDVVARYGGEEFVLILRGAGIVDAMHALERIRRRLAERLVAGNTPEYTASFGLAHSTSADRFDELFRLADQALLAAKRSGRDRIAIAGDDEPTTDPEAVAQLLADLLRAP